MASVDSLDLIRSLLRHAAWANGELQAALPVPEPPGPVLREYDHVLAAEEVWLARVDSRASRVAIWPTLTLAEADALRRENSTGYDALVRRTTPEDLEHRVEYRNSAGQPFATPLGDILLHVALHGQYHRGKVNQLLRQLGLPPAPVDYIAFVRGVPAARS